MVGVEKVEHRDLVFVQVWTRTKKIFKKAFFYIFDEFVIDTGCSNTANELVPVIQKYIKNAKFVLLTHWHEDHSGNAPLFKKFGLKILAPPLTCKILSSPPDIPEYRKIVWGPIGKVEAEPIEETIRASGVKIKPIKAPGHSPDHTIYLFDDVLFVGDLVATRKVLVAIGEEDYSKIIKTLRWVVENVDFSLALGGHVVMTRDEVKDYLAELEKLRETVIRLRREGKTTEQIVEKLTEGFSDDDITKIKFTEKFSQGEASRKRLVESLLKDER